MNIRNRVRELRVVPAAELRPNPKNWRTHPEAQRNALRGVLAEVGMAAACLARELPDGSLMLIDGHLRAETAADATVPVLVLDVDEAEADKILATFDPLAAMAESDAARLDQLLRNVDTGSDAVQEMLAAIASDAGLYRDATDGGPADSEPPSAQPQSLVFPVDDAQREVIEAALSRAKASEACEADDEGSVLAFICKAYLSTAQ